MKRRILSLICAAGFVTTVAACGSSDSGSSASDRVSYHAAFPEFASSDEMYATADSVVSGVVQPGSEVRELAPIVVDSDDPKLNPQAGTEATEEPREPVVVTVHRVRITELHKGPGKVGDVIEVKQLGGTLGKTTYESQETTSLKAGTPYLLFLNTYPDAPASVLTPIQGQYTLDGQGAPQSLPNNKLKLTDADLKRLDRTNKQ
ncbi:hypothetical protein [Embleya sp. NPDC059259]|uniref:hypothetical protein n=1 Tax=unclassified Embleya TaxID=2699296 RepID=UPI003688903C